MTPGEECLFLCLILFDTALRMSFLNSRPSHMQVHNSDIPLPPSSTIASAVDDPGLSVSCRAYVSLCQLSEIVATLQNEICTVKSQEKQRRVKLDGLAALEKEVLELAIQWKSEITGDEERKPGVSKYPTMLRFVSSLFISFCFMRFAASPSHVLPLHASADIHRN